MKQTTEYLSITASRLRRRRVREQMIEICHICNLTIHIREQRRFLSSTYLITVRGTEDSYHGLLIRLVNAGYRLQGPPRSDADLSALRILDISCKK